MAPSSQERKSVARLRPASSAPRLQKALKMAIVGGEIYAAGPWFATANAGYTAPLYMRWILGRVGMHKTGYIRYCATII